MNMAFDIKKLQSIIQELWCHRQTYQTCNTTLFGLRVKEINKIIKATDDRNKLEIAPNCIKKFSVFPITQRILLLEWKM